MSESVSVPVVADSAPSESGAPVIEHSAEVSGSQGESSNNAQIDAIADAVENGELSQAEAKSMIRKLQLKIDGKVVEREIDLDDEETLKNELQLAAKAKSSMQKAAEQEKLFKEILGKGKADIGQFMKEVYGIDPDEWAAAHIERKIEHMKKSPEVLEKERIQAELQAAREEAKKLKEEKEMAEMSKLQQEAMVGLQEEIAKAISAHTKLPNSKYVQKKMADAMLWAANNGFEDVTAEDVAQTVEAEMRQELNELYDQMPEEVLEAYVGKKNIDRLRKSRIAKAKEVPSLSQVKQTAVKPEAPSKPAEKISAKDFWRRR